MAPDCTIPDSKVHGANMGPMNFVIWYVLSLWLATITETIMCTLQHNAHTMLIYHLSITSDL